MMSPQRFNVMSTFRFPRVLEFDIYMLNSSRSTEFQAGILKQLQRLGNSFVHPSVNGTVKTIAKT